jgi:integrase
VKRAGLPSIRLHDLRHGHASIAITLDLYSHVAPGMQQDAAATVARLVGFD